MIRSIHECPQHSRRVVILRRATVSSLRMRKQQAVELLLFCFALPPVGCGGRSVAGGASMRPSGGDAGASHGTSSETQSNVAGSPGSTEQQDWIARMVASIDDICARVSECYPELQHTGQLTCKAPKANGLTMSFPSPPNIDTRMVERCLREYPDQAELAAVAQCQLDAVEAVLRCFSSCPKAADACAESRLCPHLNQETLNACYASRR
jgi:hypothetical protein